MILNNLCVFFLVLATTRRAVTHVAVHFEAAAIVHGLLLLLKLAHLLADCNALWDGTLRFLALLGMNAQQGPNALANLTSALNLLRANAGMAEVVLHLGAVGRRARLGNATGRVLYELNMHHQVTLSLQPLGVCHSTALLRGVWLNCNRGELVRTVATVHVRVLEAVLAQIVIWTRIAVVALAAENFSTAGHALLHELRGVPVVQMP